jgi:hypothetical protein
MMDKVLNVWLYGGMDETELSSRYNAIKELYRFHYRGGYIGRGLWFVGAQ